MCEGKRRRLRVWRSKMQGVDLGRLSFFARGPESGTARFQGELWQRACELREYTSKDPQALLVAGFLSPGQRSVGTTLFHTDFEYRAAVQDCYGSGRSVGH